MEWSLSGTFSELMATFADGRADVALKETALGHTLREGAIVLERILIDCLLIDPRYAVHRHGQSPSFIATGFGDRFEITAVEADAEGSYSVQGLTQT